MQKELMTKATAVHSAIYASQFNEPQWGSARYDRLAADGHNSNVWVYACINAIATSSADIPFLLYQRKGKEKVEIESHPLLDLLKTPNDFQSGRELREEWARYLLLSGRSFIEKTKGISEIAELWALRPDWVAPIPDSRDIVSGYMFRAEGGEDKKLRADQVMMWKLFDPLSMLDGRSPLQVASRIVDMDAAANDWNKALLDNGGSPPGVITTNSTLDQTTFERMSSQIRRMFGGRRNVGKFPLLEGGLTYQSTGLSPKDILFNELKLMNRIEICAVFNVPPELVGDGQNKTYSNYQEARASFYEETVLPLTGKFVDTLNSRLVPLFGDDLILEIDRDKVEALQENTDSKWKRVTEAVKEGLLSPDEGREEIGFGPKGGKAGALRPGTVSRDQNNQSSGDDDKPVKSSGSPFDAGIDSLKRILGILESKASTTDDDDAAYYKLFEAEREPFYQSAIATITERLAEEGEALANAFEKGGEPAFEKELVVQEKKWQLMMAAIYTATIDHFGNWKYDYIKAEYDAKSGAGAFEAKFFNRAFTMARRAIQKFIGEASVYAVTKINEFTRETLRAVISDGVARDQSFLSISRDIRKIHGNKFGPRRAIKIARTEIVSASNFGAREGALATGFEFTKKWVTTIDGRERDTHNECNGQERGMNDPYDIGGHPAQFPGDPKLPAKERIQCRCAEKHEIKE
jgi:HK97 family phage portal protein